MIVNIYIYISQREREKIEISANDKQIKTIPVLLISRKIK